MSLAIYEIPWYKVDVSIQKDIVIMLMRSQKYLNLKALGIVVFSHATFETVRFCNIFKYIV